MIELAVVVAIVGLLLGALLVPLSTQIQIRKNQETERRLEEAKEALMGFALANGRLPCPDIEPNPVVDGLEDQNVNPNPANGVPLCRAPLSGTTLFGVLPWQTLGLLPTDDWGRLLYYAVSEEFTYASVPGGGTNVQWQLDLGDGANAEIRVQSRDDDGVTFDLATSAPALVFSVGANGYGGRNLSGTVNGDPPTLGSFDELENYDGDEVFLTRSLLSSENATCRDDADPNFPLCAFDDLVAWLSTAVLFNRMVTAGQLP